MTKSVEVADRESIELGRRIWEILLEFQELKGDAFSESAFSERIGTTRYKLSQSMKHGRTLSPFELEQIAIGFGLSVERLKGTDVRKQREELKTLVSAEVNLQRALDLALSLLPAAIGYSERFFVLNNLGAVYYLLKRYEEAEKSWLDALVFARQINKLFEENEPLYKVSTNLLLIVDVRKNHLILHELLNNTALSFDKLPPAHAGTIIYSLGRVAFHFGNLEEYRRKLYESLNYFRQTNDKRAIGKAEHSVADVEYLLGNYIKAKEMFELAMETLSEYPVLKYYPVKDCAKTLLKLGDKERALEMINQSISDLENSSQLQPVLLAKFLLLNAYTENNAHSAKRVYNMKEAGDELRLLSCQFLMHYYSGIGDSISVMKYHRLMEAFNESFKNWEVIK